jgi:hypothetical protein
MARSVESRTGICILPLFVSTAKHNDDSNTEKKYGREHGRII